MRHPVEVTQLVLGLVFLGVAAAWGLGAAGLVDADSARWVLPLVLVVAGLAGLGATVARSRSRSDDG